MSDQTDHPPDRALAITGQGLLPMAGLAGDDQERIARYMERAPSAATLRACRSDWAIFATWCAGRALPAMPAAPPVVAAFLTELADRGLKRSTIGRRLAAIVFAHQTAGHTPPPDQVGSAILERAVRGVRKDKRDEPVDKKRAADGDVLRDMLRAIEGDRRGVERTSALPSTAIESCPRPSSRSKPLRADCKKGAKPSLHTDEPTTAIGKRQTRPERRLLGRDLIS